MVKEAKKYVVHHEGCRYEIIEDLHGLGWYVWRYENSDISTHDYLQDTLEWAIDFAEEIFGVPKELWEI